MNQAVQLQVNQRNLVQNALRQAFSNRQNVLAELMQNARRAGATYVAFEYDKDRQHLVVTDDGCGIADPQKLLSVAESGWDDAVVESDSPYGIGFLSALYTAKRIEVQSNGWMMELHPDTVLDFNMVPVTAGSTVKGSRLELDGVNLDVEKFLRDYAKGYPIDVRYNGDSLPRPHAIGQGLEFIDTPVGKMHLPGFTAEPNGHSGTGSKDFVAYLQGIRVYKSSRFDGDKVNVVHLDSTKFFGRAPDRDTLINQDEAIKQVFAVITRLWKQRLSELVSKHSDYWVIENLVPSLEKWEMLYLINNNPYLPKGTLESLDAYYPKDFTEWEDEGEAVMSIVSKEDVESGVYKIVDFDQASADEGFQVQMYAHLVGAHRIRHRLHKGHWLYWYERFLEPDDIEVQLEGETRDCDFTGNWIWNAKVVFCERASLIGPFGPVPVTEDAFVVDGFVRSHGYPCAADLSVVVVPNDCNDGQVVRQLSSFYEDSSFQESDADEEGELFRRFIMANRPGTELKLIKGLLEDANIHRYPNLAGKTFEVTITEGGNLVVLQKKEGLAQ